MVNQQIYSYKRAGGLLCKQLCCQKQRKKRYDKMDRHGIIPNQKSIEKEPTIDKNLDWIGDWEADTIISNESSSGYR